MCGVDLCPNCRIELVPIYLLGIDPDGFVCPRCNGYYYYDNDGNIRNGGMAMFLKSMRC